MTRPIRLILAASALALLALVWSCTPDSLTGTPKGNLSPTISFTNLPLGDSTYTSSAVIYWYGKDNDGIVTAYYYLVVLKDSITSLPPDSITDEIIQDYINDVLDTVPTAAWNRTSSTQTTVRLVASDDTTVSLQQYIFVKCEDDAGALSETIHLNVFRLNRLPQTFLNRVPGNDTLKYEDPESPGDSLHYVDWVWCIPDTNAIWKGLEFAWEGKDTVDFPGNQPDFQYEWKLYGAYDTAQYYDPATRRVSLKIDDVIEDSLKRSADSAWVWDKRTTLKDLPTGVYLFSVRVRDDANAPDPTPAWGTLAVVVPTWIDKPSETRDILVVRGTQYKLWSYPYHGFPYLYNADSSAYYPDSMVAFYEQMFQGAGYTADDYLIFGQPARGPLSVGMLPTIGTLAYYRMVIVDDMDYDVMELANEYENPFVAPLRNYLKVGGKAWVIGRQSFSTAGATGSGYFDFLPVSLAFEYFDLSAGIYAEVALDPTVHTGEFVGATSVFPGLGNLVLSTDRILQMRLFSGLKKVEVLLRNSIYSQALYTYEAAVPDTMPNFQYMPCAVRYDPSHHVFKTAYFSFPLYMMDNSSGQVQDVFTEMLHWFLVEN